MQEKIADRYRIEKELGKGSSGTVYKAWDEKENKPVALKLFLAVEDGTTVGTAGTATATGTGTSTFSDFLKEIKTLAKLDHPNLVKIFDAGKENGTGYLVEEYIEGKNIKEWMKNNNAYDEVVGAVEQVVGALEYVHAKDILHRDIKPTNILVDKNNNVKLVDFGVAGISDMEKIPEVSLAGTLGYMSPEQLGMIKQPVDRRSDFYSLGMTLYEGLVGELPFRSKKVEELLHQQVASLPKPIKSSRSEVPFSLDRIVLKLLQKETRQRYQSEKGLMADLQYCLSLIKNGKGDQEFELGLKDVSPEMTYRASFTGHNEDIKQLKETVDRIFDNRPVRILVSGETGVGKTRLAREAKKYVEGKGAMFLEGSSSLYSKNIPFSGISEILTNFVHFTRMLEAAAKEQWKNAILKQVGDLGGLLVDVCPTLEELIGKQPAVKSLGLEKDRFRIQTVMASFFMAICEQMPLVVFMDDWQWVDESTVRLAEEMFSHFEKKPIAFIMAARTEDVEEAKVDPKVNRIPLKNLDKTDIRRMTAELLKRKTEDIEELSERLFEKSNGNPYFYFEIVRYLVENEVVFFDNLEWQFDSEKLSRVAIPKNILNLLFSRLQVLDQQSKNILKLASVWGKKFTTNDLMRVSGLPRGDISHAIEQALKNHVIWREKRGKKEFYSFSHDRIQKELYDSLLQEERRKLHLEIAGYLEGIILKEEDVIYELARHLIEGGNTKKGVKYAILAGHKAKDNYANVDAAYFYSYALENFPEKNSAEYLELKERLGDVFSLLGRYEDGIKIFEELQPLIKEKLKKARLERKIGDQHFQTGQKVMAIDHYKKGLRYLGRRQPATLPSVGLSIVTQAIVQTFHALFPSVVEKPRLKGNDKAVEAARLYSLLGYVYFFLDLQRDLEAHLKALNLAEISGDPAVIANEYALHGVMIAPLRMLARALRYAKKGVEIARTANDKQVLGSALVHLGMVQYSRGEFNDSIKSCTEGYKMCVEVGDFWEATLGMVHLGLDYSRISEYHKSMEICEKGYEMSKRVKDYRGMGMHLIQICRNYTIWGDLQRAIEAGEEGYVYTENVKDYFLASDICFVLGRAYALYGDFNAAFDKLSKSRYYIEKKLKMKGPYAIPAYLYSGEAYLQARDKIKGLSARDKEKHLKLAEKYNRETMKLVNKFGAGYKGFALGVKGQIEIAKGNKDKAIKTLKMAIDHALSVNDKYEWGLACAALGEYLLRFDVTYPSKETLAALKEAERLFKEIDARGELEKLTRLLGRYETQKKPEEQLREKVELSSFFKVSQIMSSILDPDRLIEKIMDSIIEVLGAQRGFLFLYNEQNGKLEVRVARNLDKETINSEDFEFSRGIINYVDTSGESVVVTDAQTDERFKTKKSITTHKLKSILCSPLRYKDKNLGVIYLDNKLVTKLFTEEHLRLLSALTTQAAIALENARAYREIEKLNDSLEEKVEERTQQLRMKSDQLEMSNEELKAASQAKSQFMSSMTHELRSPLAAIIGFADLLKDGGYGQLGPDALGAVGQMEDAAQHLMGLINDILDMAKIEAGKMEVRPQDFLVKDCVDTVLATVIPLAEQRKLELKQDVQVEVAYGDLKRVSQILWNLLSNSIKFTNEGSIEVRAWKEGDKCVISVKDSGIGIPEDKKEKVFATFEQVDPKHKGTGLGMSISKQLVEMHGGKIWFESIPGQGSTFYFTLPYRS
ncbi:MAG: protein kinase [Candidatus Margulisbacteria bacterium]|nr:protein kinase [Candidatus Margulisiibacteriota bacterium]